MYHNILIVCLGNICRSPTAERIMQKKLPGHRISSAGIKALAGKDADFQAIKTALKHRSEERRVGKECRSQGVPRL